MVPEQFCSYWNMAILVKRICVNILMMSVCVWGSFQKSTPITAETGNNFLSLIMGKNEHTSLYFLQAVFLIVPRCRWYPAWTSFLNLKGPPRADHPSEVARSSGTSSAVEVVNLNDRFTLSMYVELLSRPPDQCRTVFGPESGCQTPFLLSLGLH